MKPVYFILLGIDNVKRANWSKMNPELVLKYGSGVGLGYGVLYTIIRVAEKGNGAKVESPYGSITFERPVDRNMLEGIASLKKSMSDLQDGHLRVLSELRDFKCDVDKRLDLLSTEVDESNSRTSQGVKALAWSLICNLY